MFNKTLYQHKTFGKINMSHSYTSANFKGVTTGLAIKYVLEGKECYVINDKKLYLHKGQFIILNEATKYKVFTKNEYTKGLCLDIKSELLNSTEIDLIFNTTYGRVSGLGLGKFLNDISNSIINQDIKNPIHIIDSLSKEVSRFKSNLDDLKHSLSSITTKTTTQQCLITKVLLVKDYIYLHYTFKISLDTLATVAGMSKYHLSRIFKHCFKISPLEFQDQLRMQKAKELLLENDKKLTTIAFLLGYYDLATFSKKFKTYYHITPSKFRE